MRGEDALSIEYSIVSYGYVHPLGSDELPWTAGILPLPLPVEYHGRIADRALHSYYTVPYRTPSEYRVAL